jgi:hypothetical protein
LTDWLSTSGSLGAGYDTAPLIASATHCEYAWSNRIAVLLEGGLWPLSSVRFRVQGERTPELLTGPERQANGRRGAWKTLARYDARYLTERARTNFLRSFELQADPEGVLSPEERTRRARYLLKLHMSDLGRRSGQVRRSRAGQ